MPRGIEALTLGALLAAATAAAAAPGCDKPVYLTFDTGHMGVAPLVAQVLQRQQVKATFFLADERTLDDGSSLDDEWAPWWRARAAEGHAFGSHTWSHAVWRADQGGGAFTVQPTAGPRSGQRFTLDEAGYCAELRKPAERFEAMTGQKMLPLFRAPGGKTSPALLAAARRCGFEHVGWAPAGFLGDELPSDRHPNSQLLARALRDIRAGDILLAHLGIWSRKDPWAPAVLEPLVEGLKQRGFCFATLRDHPQFAAWAARPVGR
ncbi:polysaccharide deacetylase family protein [Azohydromonas aeria]|uniref:polysaccharide deacetylase family protein n=1 Tax=Azohydromonas aeria TaxID=2590212 RepID=UPI0012F98D2C|nr:polysaccharide deacetylase family protein [Azohydromonas aeria]